jgi:hypothetical protein
MKSHLGKIALVTLLGLSVAQMAIAADGPDYGTKKLTKKQQKALKKALKAKNAGKFISKASKKTKRNKRSSSEALSLVSSCTYDQNFSNLGTFTYAAPNGTTYDILFDTTADNSSTFNPSDANGNDITIGWTDKYTNEDGVTITTKYSKSGSSSKTAALDFKETVNDSYEIYAIKNVTPNDISNVFNAVIELESNIDYNVSYGGSLDITATGINVSPDNENLYPQYTAFAYIGITNGTQNDLYFANELFYKKSDSYVPYALCLTQFAGN